MLHKNITCSVCGLACDDIDIELTRDDIKVYNACSMGEAKYHKLRDPDRILKPIIGGKEAGWKDAIKKTAEILGKAKRPLIFMGSEISTESMRVGIEMAEYLGGVVDGNSTMCHGPTVLGIQEAGLPSATLGEVKNRADLLIYWGCNPIESHPRLLSRYSLFPRGYFREHGGQERTAIVVDPRKTPTTELADLHIRIEPNKDFELMSAIGAVINGHDIDKAVGGVPPKTIRRLAEMMKSCKYGVIFVGLGIASSVGKYRNLEKAMRLVRNINKYSRLILLANRGHSNVAGFNQIMTWTSGYPFGVDYSRRIPRFNPGETTTVDLLARGEVDAVLVVGADLGAHLPREAIEHLADIPLISVEVAHCPTTMLSNVIIPDVLNAMECEGTFYRMDNVPIHVRKFAKSPLKETKSTVDTMKQVLAEIKKVKG